MACVSHALADSLPLASSVLLLASTHCPSFNALLSSHFPGFTPHSGHLPILTSNLLQAVLSGQGGETLGAVLGAMADEIQSECGFLLEVAHNPQSGLHSFNLLSNSILREVHQALAQSLSRAFSPGVPAAFHANYHSAMTFLQVPNDPPCVPWFSFISLPPSLRPSCFVGAFHA